MGRSISLCPPDVGHARSPGSRLPRGPRWPEIEALLRAGLSEQAAETLAAFEKRFGTNKRCHLSATRAQAVLATAQGRYEGAQACLQEASALARELNLPGELWQTEAALGRLYVICEKPKQAVQAFARASDILETLAGTVTDEELRSHFLRAPQVQQILLQGKGKLL